jgi:hypothetical protein
MKLLEPENANYAAVVVSIKTIVPLEGCDNVVGTPLLGFQAIVGKDTQVGDLGIVFPAESQLSEEYARLNNLHRHGDLNDNEGAKGYLEDNRRVKAMKFRGHRSDCLFMPLSSLSYIKNLDISLFNEGDIFDKIGDNLVCNKYLVPRTNREARLEKNKAKFIRVDKKFLPEHYDTDNYFRNAHVIPESREVVVTQKLHGTSIRIANTFVARRLSTIEKFAKRVGIHVQETEMDYVYGSRKVIKDVHNPNQNHFYTTDIWTEEGEKLQGVLPENFLLYGELVGWTGVNTPIQKHYTYNAPQGTCDLYIYRVAFVNGDGFVCDLAWDQVVEFCRDRGIKTVPELWRGKYADFKVEDFIDKRFHEEGYAGVVPLSPDSPVDEGVCIRLDGIAPYILKAKGEQFYAHESAMIDEEAEDLEAEGSEV